VNWGSHLKIKKNYKNTNENCPWRG
jgi:hypothetical protein